MRISMKTLTMSCYRVPVVVAILLLATVLLPSSVWSSIPTGTSDDKSSHPSTLTSSFAGVGAPSDSSSHLPSDASVRDSIEAFQKHSDSFLAEDEEESQIENSSEYSHSRPRVANQNAPSATDDDASFSNSQSLANSDSDYAGDEPPGSGTSYFSKTRGNDNVYLKGDIVLRGSSSTTSPFSNPLIHGSADKLRHRNVAPTPNYGFAGFDDMEPGLPNIPWECKKDKDSSTSGERLTDTETLNLDFNTKCTNNHKQSTNDSVITLGFLSPYNQNQFSLGAMRLAVERVNNDPELLPGRTLRYIAADIGSSDLLLTSRPIKIMTEMRDRGTIGFIGGPEDTCISEALVAAAWNLPMISYKCSDHRVSDKKTYTTFARTLPPSSKVSKSVVALLKAFSWDKLVLVVCPSKDDRYTELVTNAFTNLAKKHKIDITATYSIADYIPDKRPEMEDIVKKSLPNTRVYVFIGEHVALVAFLREMAEKGAFDNGEYIIISIDDKLNISGKFFEVDWLDKYLFNKTGDDLWDIKTDMIKAFRSVLKLIPSHPRSGYLGDDVQRLIKKYSRGDPFCVPYSELIYEFSEIPVEAAYLYDAVMIYARAVDGVLKDGEDPRNGTAIFEKIRNKSYESIQGFDVFMDENGDAEGNYTVVSLLPDDDGEGFYLDMGSGNGSKSNTSGFYAGESNFYGSFEWNPAYEYWDPDSNSTIRLSMQPVGYFTQVSSPSTQQTAPSSSFSASSTSSFPKVSSTGTITSHQKNDNANNNDADKVETPAEDVFAFRYFNESRKIQWVGGKPPKAEPRCGFKGERCEYKPDWRTLSVCSIAAAVLAVVLVMAVRHYRYEQKLACLLWKIDMQHVVLLSDGPMEPVNGAKNTVGICRPLLGTTAVDAEPPLELACKKAYTRIGFYKGMVVAVKPIYKRSIDLTRNIRKELIQIREVRHENIIPFIGASVDHGNICILTAYSARGSLEDVLQNEDLHLDNMFLASLVADLIKGMIYLHDSEIISHGNLKSSNCLVDSRWVLQIADFGLHEFKAGQENRGNTEKEIRKLLWRAPELLRDPNAHPRGTQKGDVYSFGIILYEMIGRSGPWGKTQLSIPEIIEKVTTPKLVDPSESETGYLRPSTMHLDCGETVLKCLEACWEEDQDLRPDFRFIRVRLKEMQAGLKPNIFDNMLSIMEKYACNLEDLVQERTIQLVQEKRKTDALLHRMLPKSVAESLKRGDPVEAESFDSVTIYFSDIVGFTALSAVSTPLQVVELLNDLYTCFDSIISNYDVYKVETIGDAYVVVSGLPIRNGNQHAGEIASMSLHLLDRIKSFEIRHRPGERLKLRIGIHTGCVVAGVVGLKMPRYCLFGDTVNTASRMESTGEPLKIHISNVTKSVLEQIGGYYYEERGIIPIKGKGEMCTYWLIGEDSTRTRKNSAESNNPVEKEDNLTHHSVNSSPPKNGVIGFGQDGGESNNFDLNEVSATVTNNNNFQTFACENAGECNGSVCVNSPAYNQGNSTTNTITTTKAENSVVSVDSNSLANGSCHRRLTVPGDNGRPIYKGSPTDLSPSSTDNNVYDLSGNNLSIPNGKVTFKPTTWLLAECQNGKVDHHGNLLKSIGGKYVSCSNVFQECKVNIIKELKKNGNTAAAAAAAAAFNCNNGKIGNHFLPSQQNGSTNRFRSAPIITFMETSAPNPTSAPLFAFEERNFV